MTDPHILIIEKLGKIDENTVEIRINVGKLQEQIKIMNKRMINNEEKIDVLEKQHAKTIGILTAVFTGATFLVNMVISYFN